MKNNSSSKKISVMDIIANIPENHMWTGNILQKIAEENIRYGIPTEEIIKIDLSVKLLKELERQIKNKETISLQINAKPRMAKSTTAIRLGEFILEILKKYGMRDKKDKFGMKNMARDQNERIKKMRNPDLMHDIIVTDESNALEDTGENATVEKAQREVFSDVQAGRYVHGIWVCPEGTMDKNCDIKLEIRNKDKGLVHTRVYYNSKSSSFYGWVLVGIADFDVSSLIKNWMKVEPRFFKYLKDKQECDRKFIEYWSKRDFYVEYMCKKYEKMELMNREGILHSRDLDYADIRKAVVNSLKPLAEIPFVPMNRLKNNIKSRIEIEFRKRKMPMSMLGRELEFERIAGMLELYRSLIEIEMNIKSVLKKLQDGRITKEEHGKVMEVLQKGKEEIKAEIINNEQYLERLAELKEKYEEHLE